MTAHAMKGDRERCLDAGMDGYVAKPIRAAVLFQVIAKVLDGNPLPPAEPSPPAEPDPPEPVGVDWAAASEATGGDPKLLNELVQGFLDECPRLAADVRRAVESGDAKQLAAAAHQLKGAIRYFGPGTAFQLAWQLEKEARSGNLGDTRSHLQRRESTLARLRENIADQSNHWRS
jgi:HPt (histidine-containing phosphotransfer) domain-containing protein